MLVSQKMISTCTLGRWISPLQSAMLQVVSNCEMLATIRKSVLPAVSCHVPSCCKEGNMPYSNSLYKYQNRGWNTKSRGNIFAL